MEKKWTLRLPRYTLGFGFQIALKPREGVKVVGVTNKVGHYYLPFFDYDITNQAIVENDVRSLQETFTLGDAFLFRTKKGFHVIILDLLTGEEWRRVLEESNCDEEYKSIPLHNKARVWVLRLSDKPDNHITYVDYLEGYNGRPISEPHRRLLLARGVDKARLERLKIYSSATTEPLMYAGYEA
jgi:hypothetical protein